MPIPGPKVMRFSLAGNIGGESWSCGHWKSDERDTTPTPAQLNTYAGTCLAAFNTHVWSNATNGFRNYNSTDTTLGSIKIWYYTAGVLTGLGTASISPVAGLGSSDPHPAYVAWCVSLLSALPGRSRRGRMYLPATAMAVSGATSQASSSAFQDDTLQHVVDYLHDAGTNVPPWGATGNAVNKIVSEVLGSMVDMTAARLDSLPDTQHGRSRKLVSVHTSSLAV